MEVEVMETAMAKKQKAENLLRPLWLAIHNISRLLALAYHSLVIIVASRNHDSVLSRETPALFADLFHCLSPCSHVSTAQVTTSTLSILLCPL
jgi:hypothetical protein